MELQEQQKQDWANKGYFFVRNVLDDQEIINCCVTQSDGEEK